MALQTLCSTGSAFMAILFMAGFLLSAVIYLTYAFVKKEKAIRNLAIALFLLSVLGVFIYVFTPVLMNTLLGEAPLQGTECVDSADTYPPFCGWDYCNDGTGDKSAENCTCIMY